MTQNIQVFDECLGCSLANKKIEPIFIVHENEHFLSILDHEPFSQGHTLILPKSHVNNWSQLTADQSLSFIEMMKRIEKIIQETFHDDGITMCQNGGVFDDLEHLHIHLVPRTNQIRFENFYSKETIDNTRLKEKIAETLFLMKKI